MDESLDTWFVREILAHEESLVRNLSHAWPNRHELQDLRQDTYVRVYEAAAKSRPVAPKSFLFATARHLIVDRIRRRRVVAIDAVGDLEASNVMVDERSPEQRTSAYEELRRLAEAFDMLPASFQIGESSVYLRAQDIYHSFNSGNWPGNNPDSISYDPAIPLPPATNVLDLRAGVVWGSFDLSLFVNNATNSHPTLLLFHALPGDPLFTASTFQPLTAGVTLVYHH